MVNYEALPLFPLHVVLYPDMPLPLHIFEPRYKEMIKRCREEKSQFGIVLIKNDADNSTVPVSYNVGTTARITQYEELSDGRINIEVVGETRFRITEIYRNRPYLTASVEPFWEIATDPYELKPAHEKVSGLFRTYLRSLLAMTNRSLGLVRLPSEPEFLSYAIASVLQIPMSDKQGLLEIVTTETRLRRETDILQHEILAQQDLNNLISKPHGAKQAKITPMNYRNYSNLICRN